MHEDTKRNENIDNPAKSFFIYRALDKKNAAYIKMHAARNGLINSIQLIIGNRHVHIILGTETACKILYEIQG
ncbi:MAG: hypothetical protein IKW61_01045, partial [Bacteroidaceae bacterium]|nr:hypothetical protein [Bacteroidaceae bacterium]